MNIMADGKCAPEIYERQIGSVNLCGVRRKQKKIIKISNGNEWFDFGYRWGGVAPAVYTVLKAWKQGSKPGRKAQLYIIPIILNNCTFSGFFLLFFLVFRIKRTAET